jgi:cell wall-associated NlpC family hydrolase
MLNRNLSSRVFVAAVLSFAANPLLHSDPESSADVSDTATSTAPATPSSEQLGSYTVRRGDTLGSIARRHGMSLQQLKRLNNLPATSVGVKRGQVLQVVANISPEKTHDSYAVAQPVQDFDLHPPPAESSGADTASSVDADSGTTTPPVKHAPIAKLVSPAELALAEAQANAVPVTPAPAQTDFPKPSFSSKHPASAAIVSTPDRSPAPASVQRPAPHLTSTRSSSAKWNPFASPAPTDFATLFIQQARALGDQGIEYDEDWRPPGESHAWAMDCSNTTRYIYKVATGIELPRTASDQYYYLHLQGKAWDVPPTSDRLAAAEYLRHNLKPGDLLFWENTYRPERQPPITHVMIFLGTNQRDEWMMAGSQTSRGGEHNRRNGGPDIYVFRPFQPCGGYTTWLGLVHHKGRFCAFGRPLEADRSKLSVAADN